MMGTGAIVDRLAPSWSGDAAKRRWWARSERLCGGPRHFKALLEFWVRIDVRPALESVQAPTLLMRRRGDRDVVRGQAEYLAERIPQTRYVEFDGEDSVWFAGDADVVLDEIETFITGTRGAKRRTAFCRQCCLPISSIRRSAQRNWVTKCGRKPLPPMIVSSNNA
jgi:hypothetical protein